MSANKVAVVGAGYWGRNLVRNFHALGALAAICDTDPAVLKELGGKYGARTTPDFQALLAEPAVAAVVIAAPAAQHYELAKQALLAGKDVFVEKPLALRVEQGRELVELAERSGRILMVGHLLQYHPAVLELKRRVQAGELGRIRYVYSSRLNLGKLRTEENILWSFAPHDISAILYLLEERPERVAASGGFYLHAELADTTLTTCDFKSGVKAHIFVSWLHPFKEQKLTVVGDAKMAVFDDTEPERKLVLYPHRIHWRDRVPVAEKAEAEVVPLPAIEPLRAECEHFLECVEQRRTPRTSGANGLAVLEVLDACEQSLRQKGVPVETSRPTPAYYAHPTAVIDEGCSIGEGTKIWHFSHIMAKSRIGRKCNLGQNVVVSPDVVIGNNVKIQNNVSVYTGVVLEDDVFCGPSMVFTNVVNPRSHIVRRSEYKTTLVRRGASIGANATIVCGITIGQYAFIAAGAVVTRDVPDYALMVGSPARRKAWMCYCGVRLPEGKTPACAACGRKYEVAGESCQEVAVGAAAAAGD